MLKQFPSSLSLVSGSIKYHRKLSFRDCDLLYRQGIWALSACPRNSTRYLCTGDKVHSLISVLTKSMSLINYSVEYVLINGFQIKLNNIYFGTLAVIVGGLLLLIVRLVSRYCSPVRLFVVCLRWCPHRIGCPVWGEGRDCQLCVRAPV